MSTVGVFPGVPAEHDNQLRSKPCRPSAENNLRRSRKASSRAADRSISGDQGGHVHLIPGSSCNRAERRETGSVGGGGIVPGDGALAP